MSRIFSFIVAVIIIGVSVAVATFLVSLAPEPARSEPPPQIPFAQTGLVLSESGAIPVYGAGTVRPSAEVDITPQVGGKIVWVEPGFQSGGRVEAGQTIFRIEEADYLYRVQEAEANLAAHRVSLLEEQEEAAIARAEYESYSDRQGDTASPSAASPLTLREPQLDAVRAALKRDEARLADARLALSRTRVTAPFDGFVRNESVDVGQIVSPGQAVGRLFAADAVEVVLPLSDNDAALIPGLWKLQAGDEEAQVSALVVTRYGDSSYAWEGYVDRGEVSLDEQTRTIDVIVRVPEPFSAGFPVGRSGTVGGSPPLLVGEFVEVEIQGMSMDGYFKIARAALHPGDEVWAVNGNGVVSIIPVQVLQRADDEVFVTGDLESGQAVITGGIQFATEGMRVRPAKSSLLHMIDFIDQKLGEGAPTRSAVIEGAKGRFRPILLTSVTTFLGFTPLILETSIQAQFLVPFAASLGFGIMITTGILMMLVPALYTIHLRLISPREKSGIPAASTHI